jgi:hypothetical protein
VKPCRLIAIVLGLAVAIAACDRVVDLSPPDAGHADGRTGDSAGNDGFLPDGGSDGGTIQDGGSVPDAFTGD